jgi:hypothetical protein
MSDIVHQTVHKSVYTNNVINLDLSYVRHVLIYLCDVQSYCVDCCPSEGFIYCHVQEGRQPISPVSASEEDPCGIEGIGFVCGRFGASDVYGGRTGAMRTHVER